MRGLDQRIHEKHLAKHVTLATARWGSNKPILPKRKKAPYGSLQSVKTRKIKIT